MILYSKLEVDTCHYLMDCCITMAFQLRHERCLIERLFS